MKLIFAFDELGDHVYLVLLRGYLMYASHAAIGAVVDNETDTQQFMLPILCH